MPIKIKFIKNCDGGKIGDIKNYSNKSAESLVSQGYAEYVKTIDCANFSSDKSKFVTSEVTKSMSEVTKNDKKISSDKCAQSSPKCTNISTGNEGLTCKNDKNNQNYPFCNDLSPVTSVTLSLEELNSSNKQSDRNDKSDNFSELDFDSVSEAVGKTKLSLIYSLLYVNKRMNRKQIAKELGIELNTVTVTMNRTKDRFLEGELIDGLISYKLSPLAIQEVEKKLEGLTKVKQSIEAEKQKKKDKESASKLLKQQLEQSLNDMKPTIQDKIVTIDFKELLIYNQDLADKLLDNPIEAIENIISHYETLEVEDVRFINLPKTQYRTAEALRCKDIDKLIVVEGRCISLSSPRPVITESKYECPNCGSVITMVQTENKLQEPNRCTCGRRGGFKELSVNLEDASNIVIEDLQDNTENPNTQRINARIQNWLVEKQNIGVFNLGDEVRVTGLLRTVKSFNRGVETVNRGYLFEILDAEKKEEEIIIDNFTEEEIKQIKNMANLVDKRGIKEIAESFAPDVFGYEYIKNAIILQACNRRNNPNESSTRNKQNILLIGDPGIAKSVLCKYSMAVTPGSRKASGGGSSAVGITASVVKEDESMGGYRIEAGALPLAKELLFLDEMNNLTEDDKPKLQEAMSEQMISINKANLHVNLKVTAGVLATANPIKGHFIENTPYNKQFNIPSPILNRFDVIFIMKDIPNKERDEAIADIMIKRSRGEIKPEYSVDDLKKFFAYVRNSKTPIVDDNIATKLKEVYSDSRKNRNADVIINPRFMEALSRMIEASAKMRLSDKVEEKDIKRALDILSESHFKSNEYKNFDFGGIKWRK